MFMKTPLDATITIGKAGSIAMWKMSSGWHVSVYYIGEKIENWDYTQVSNGKEKYIVYNRDISTGKITKVKYFNALPLYYGN